MSLPGRTFHIRLPPHLQHVIETLHARHYCGLPVSTVLKLLIVDQLSKDERELARIVAERIKKGGRGG